MAAEIHHVFSIRYKAESSRTEQVFASAVTHEQALALAERLQKEKPDWEWFEILKGVEVVGRGYQEYEIELPISDEAWQRQARLFNIAGDMSDEEVAKLKVDTERQIWIRKKSDRKK